MVQINDDNYEDLTEASMGAVLDALAAGKTPKPGPQVERQTSCPDSRPDHAQEDGRAQLRLPGACGDGESVAIRRRDRRSSSSLAFTGIARQAGRRLALARRWSCCGRRS